MADASLPKTFVSNNAVKIGEKELGNLPMTRKVYYFFTGSTLFVKNLSFSMTTVRLTQMFRALPVQM